MCEEIEIIVEAPEPRHIEVHQVADIPVIEVEVPGIQGPSSAERPLDIDPVKTYLKHRGEI